MGTILRVYAALLRLYPRRFREAYGDELLRNARERSEEARFGRGPAGRFRFALFLLADLLRSLPREHIRARADAFGFGPRADSAAGGGSSGALAWDLLFAIRSFRTRPGFTLVVVGTLALGIGATTAIFSVTDAVLLRPLPYPEPDRLVQLGARYEGYDGLASVSPPDFRDWQQRTVSFEALAASRLERRVLRSGERPEFVNTAGVSPGFFELFGVEPARGRNLTRADGIESPAAVVSHGFRERRLGGDADPLGRVLRLGKQSFTVVGVLPPDFHPPEAIYHQGTEVWYPLRWIDDPLDDRGAGFLQVVGRLSAGVTVNAARDEMEALGRALTREYPDAGERRIGVAPLRERTVAGVGHTLYLFVGAVGLLLAIACANVAHLFLVRATERRREMAVRTAVGASRRRLLRQLLTESLFLSVLGGALGAVLAEGGIRVFKALAPGAGSPTSFLPRLSEVGMDLRVLAFAGALALATGIVFGLVPALRIVREGSGEALKESTGSTTSGPGRGRLRSLLLVGETAVSLVLLFGAGLLLHSFVRLARVDPGFDTDGVAYASVATDDGYETAAERKALFSGVLRELEGDPRVTAAGAVHNLPLDGNQTVATITVEGTEIRAEADAHQLGYHQVMPGYFRTLGIERMQGRTFSWDDDENAPPVAVVNESMARRFWPDEGAVGGRVRIGGPDSDGAWLTVVGVVRDVRQYGLARETGPELFLPFLQSPRTRMHVVARTDGEAGSLVAVLRSAVARADPGLPVRRAGTLGSHVSRSLAEPRFYTTLLGTFAGVALLLTFVGVYGTVSYSVQQRTREMGIRIALGAGAARVAGMVVREGMARTGVGVVLGVGCAWASGRLLEGYVHGFSPTDPATLGVVGLGVLVVTLLACYLPARRITRIDPMATLRTE